MYTIWHELRENSAPSVLEQPHTNACVDSNSPFTITDHRIEHTPYSHNTEIHQWLKHMTRQHPQLCDHENYPPPPLLYEVEDIDAATT